MRATECALSAAVTLVLCSSALAAPLLGGALLGFGRSLNYVCGGFESQAEADVDSVETARPAAQLQERPQRSERGNGEALQNMKHLSEDPAVVHVCAVAPDILCITLQAQLVDHAAQLPYREQPGDEIRPEGHEVLAWHRGQIVRTKKDLQLFRRADGGLERAGWLVANDAKYWPQEGIEGRELNVAALPQPAAYRISSQDDPRYATPAEPAAVHRKSKPNDYSNDGKMPVRHWVYLRLPHPLREDATYTVAFVGLNTHPAQVRYVHSPQDVRSDAVHVTQVGYRPDDPFKRAYLSTWLGTGGALRYDAERFYLVEAATGRRVYEGQVRLAFGADEPERMKEEKNYNGTDVYHLDFTDFSTPGIYRVLVPGIGVSYAFRIAQDPWARAFHTSMLGFLHHRSGIALGPPFTDYVRPRPFHPADGMQVFELDITYWSGEASAVLSALERMLGPELAPSKLTTRADAWGGYMDAGDWDRRSQHLMPSYLHLELLDMFPEYFADLQLGLPAQEASNNLPDVLDEALWNIAFYRRLQRPDGGVGGGVESTAHPRTGECSWQESLCVGTFAPDPETSLRYAACAAKAARLLRRWDRELAQGYSQSALRAWRWAEQNAERMLAQQPGKERSVRNMRTLAAVELYHLTADADYHAVAEEGFRAEDFDRLLHAWFAYALLPGELADARLKGEAAAGYRRLGDAALEFSRGNAFNISTHNPYLPMIGYVGYWSTPGMTVGPCLPRAHYLTGEERYLAGAVAACNYSAGANPMNMTLTTGLGHDWPRHPLHIDSRRSGQQAPAGITVYGPSDPATEGRAYDWAHKWRLGPTMVPNSRTWPASEFYIDIYGWPAMNEYTVQQTFGPTSYHWGYLAARQ